jgi:predicted RNA-binding Zn ribbon-like protein
MSSVVTDITTTGNSRAEDLLVVANTRHGPGGHHRARALTDGPDHDHLHDPADARAYLVDHRVTVPPELPPPAALARMARLRDLVRREAADRPLGAPPAVRPTDEEIAAAIDGVAFRLGLEGPHPVRTGWTGFVDGLLPALLELRSADARLRVCGNPRCRFAFLDRSRNRSRVWCESAACGNRIRVGRHRRRARHHAGPPGRAIAPGPPGEPASPRAPHG